MRRSCAIVFLTLVFNGIAPSDSSCASTFLEKPSIDSLFGKWNLWSTKLDSVDSRHIVTRLASKRVLAQYGGYEWRLVDTHRLKNDYFAYDREYGPEHNANRDPRFHITFYDHEFKQDENSIVLVKNNRLSDWYLSQRINRNLSELVDDLEMVYHIPGFEKNSNLIDLYEFSRIDDLSDDQNEVYDFEVKNPIAELVTHDLGKLTATGFRVFFARDVGWLPNRLEVKYTLFTITFEFLDWRQFEDIMVPRKVEIWDQGSVFYSLEFEKIERCSEAEVKKRCTLSFYDLPDLALPIAEAKSTAWWYWLVPIAACLLGWFVLKKRSAA